MLEATAEVTLTPPSGRLPAATPPTSFGFIITLSDGESFSSAVVPDG